jgi:hypothetical protein
VVIPFRRGHRICPRPRLVVRMNHSTWSTGSTCRRRTNLTIASEPLETIELGIVRVRRNLVYNLPTIAHLVLFKSARGTRIASWTIAPPVNATSDQRDSRRTSNLVRMESVVVVHAFKTSGARQAGYDITLCYRSEWLAGEEPKEMRESIMWTFNQTRGRGALPSHLEPDASYAFDRIQLLVFANDRVYSHLTHGCKMYSVSCPRLACLSAANEDLFQNQIKRCSPFLGLPELAGNRKPCLAPAHLPGGGTVLVGTETLLSLFTNEHEGRILLDAE